MCRCFIVVKLVLVRLLLASICGLTPMTVAYDFGYHPSAEEFDGVLRDTYRTWTHDILKQQPVRELYKKSNPSSEIRSYVPKFHIESQKRHDLEESPSSIITSATVNQPNFISSLNFHFDNDDNDDNDENEHFNNVYYLDKPKDTENPMSSITSPTPELNLKPLAKPDLEKYSLNNLYHNNSHAHFPIYFTNPATGIVYSITEMGKTSENLTRSNGSIPIFITKDQYERDVQLLKQEYENKCQLDSDRNENMEFLRPSSFSRRPTTTTTTSTTVRPQIIRLNKPLSSASSAIKHLTPLKRPGAGVVVRKEITVKDTKLSTPRPLRKKKKPKSKSKMRRTHPPGHQQRVVLPTTSRPSVGHTIESVWPGGPTIVRGTRTTTKRPYLNNIKLPTQLEKPNFESTIFSTEVMPPTASSEIWQHHRLNLNDRKKRSIKAIRNSSPSEEIHRNSQSQRETSNEINRNFQFSSKLSEMKFLKATKDLENPQNTHLFLKNHLKPFRNDKNNRYRNLIESNSKPLKQKRNKRSLDNKNNANSIKNVKILNSKDSDKEFQLQKTNLTFENFLENFEIENNTFDKGKIFKYPHADEKHLEIDLKKMLKVKAINQGIELKSENPNKSIILKNQTKLLSDPKRENHENFDKLQKDLQEIWSNQEYPVLRENENHFIDKSDKTNSENINLSKSYGNYENVNNKVFTTNKYSNVQTTSYEENSKFKTKSGNLNSSKFKLIWKNFIQPKDNQDNSAMQPKKVDPKLNESEEISNTIKPIVAPITKIDNLSAKESNGNIESSKKLSINAKYSKQKNVDENSINKYHKALKTQVIENDDDQVIDNENLTNKYHKAFKTQVIKNDDDQVIDNENLSNKYHKALKTQVIDNELVLEKNNEKSTPMENEENSLHTEKNTSEIIKKIDIMQYSIIKQNDNRKVWRDNNKNSPVNSKVNNNRNSKYLYKKKNNNNKNLVEISLFNKTLNIARDATSQAILKNSPSKLLKSETSKSTQPIKSVTNNQRHHHIAKRSTAPIRQNIFEPKFVKKTNSSRPRYVSDLQIIDNTHVDGSTIMPAVVIESNTIRSHAEFNFEMHSNESKTSNDPDTLKSINEESINDRFHLNSKNFKITNSSENSNAVGPLKRERNRSHTKRYRKKSHKKRKRIENQTIQNDSNTNDLNSMDSNDTESSTDRSIKEAVTKIFNRLIDGKAAKDDDDNEDDDEDDEYEDDDDDDEDDDDDDDGNDGKKDKDYYIDDLKEIPIRDNTSSAEEGVDIGALEEENKITPPPAIAHKKEPETTSNSSNKNKNDIHKDNNNNKYNNDAHNDIQLRIRKRRPTANRKADDDDDDDDDLDDDDESALGSNLGGFFRMIFYPVQIVMSSIMETFLSGKEPEQHSVHTYPQYTSYHNTLKQHSNDDEYSYDDDNYNDDDYDSGDGSESSLGSWLSSWFGLSRRNKKISSTTMAPSAAQRRPTKQSSNWFQSWFSTGDNDGVDKADTEDYDDYDKWFASWFGKVQPKARKRKTTTTSTTTQLPQVPILTIVDPMRNPQNWIGILAHHIINQTTTTQNPLRDIWSKITTPETTTTTTENPEIPRKISYNKYQIWRLKPQDDYQVQALEDYKKGDEGIKLQWLKGPSLRGLTDVLVPPRMLVNFQASLTFESIDHEVLIFDVGKAIAYEKSKEDYFFTTTQRPKRKQPNRYANKPQPAMTWMRYYEFDDIVTYMESMRMRYPQLVELIHIGRSYEGRPLIVMKIESKEAAATNSPDYAIHEKAKLKHKKRIGLANAVFIEAGIHGMEWIAPATATWIINELLKSMKTTKILNDEANLIRNTTWFIMPVLNPDGYVYSHEYDRFWKKSRSRHISQPSGLINSAMTWLQQKKTKDRVCFGVDLDRNWNYQWGKRGSSKSSCNEFFAGPGPFSEPETKALSEFLMDYRTHIKLFISMQAYGQIISYPYKANTTYDAERLDDFLDVAMVGTDGLRKKGSKSRYKIDSTNDLVENRSGCSDAFVAYDVGIPFSYTLQLADNGVHGYLLPSSSIESTSRDAFEIIKAMLDYI